MDQPTDAPGEHGQVIGWRSCPLDLNLRIEVGSDPDAGPMIAVNAWTSRGTVVLMSWPLTAEQFALMWDDYTRASWREFVLDRVNWPVLFLPVELTHVLGTQLVAGDLPADPDAPQVP